jgi:hypothetical protein
MKRCPSSSKEMVDPPISRHTAQTLWVGLSRYLVDLTVCGFQDRSGPGLPMTFRERGDPRWRERSNPVDHLLLLLAREPSYWRCGEELKVVAVIAHSAAALPRPLIAL